MLGIVTVAVLVGVNAWLYQNHSLVLPLASALAMAALAFVFNMGWGYFIESRARARAGAAFRHLRAAASWSTKCS